MIYLELRKQRALFRRKKPLFLSFDPSVKSIADSDIRTKIINEKIADCKRANTNLFIYTALFEVLL